MVDFSNINESLNREETNERENLTVEIITLSGVQKYEVKEGTTVEDFKNEHNLTDVKIVDEDGDVLDDDDTLEEDCQLFVSTPKKNG